MGTSCRLYRNFDLLIAIHTRQKFLTCWKMYRLRKCRTDKWIYAVIHHEQLAVGFTRLHTGRLTWKLTDRCESKNYNWKYDTLKVIYLHWFWQWLIQRISTFTEGELHSLIHTLIEWLINSFRTAWADSYNRWLISNTFSCLHNALADCNGHWLTIFYVNSFRNELLTYVLSCLN